MSNVSGEYQECGYKKLLHKCVITQYEEKNRNSTVIGFLFNIIGNVEYIIGFNINLISAHSSAER